MEERKEWTCMQFNIKLLRYAGTWPYWSRKDEFREKIYICYSTGMILIAFVYVLIQVYGLSVYYRSWETLDAAIEDVIVVMTGTIVLFKMVLIVINQQKLEELINYIRKDLNVRELSSEVDQKVMINCVRHEKKLTKSYLGFAYPIVVLYTIASIVKIFKYRHAEEYHDTLPLKYPFQLKYSPTYEIAWIHQFIIMLINCQVGTCADSLFSCLVYYICGHFTVLYNRIITKNSIKVEDKTIEYHREIIGLVDKVQSIFGSFLMFQFTVNSILICLAVFQITQIVDIRPIHYAKCFVYLIIKLTQLFLYCWYGQELNKRSMLISQAVYDLNWYQCRDKRDLDNTRFIILRSQKPVQITAGFFDVSLTSFKSVMNTAYTYFTLLKTMDNS